MSRLYSTLSRYIRLAQGSCSRKSPTRASTGRMRQRARLSLETLEDRMVPSALSIADVTVREGPASLGALDPTGAANLGLAGPRIIAFDSIPGSPHYNDLFVTSYQNQEVLRFDWASQTYQPFVAPQSGGMQDLGGLTFGPDGNLYLSTASQSSVLEFDGTTGSFLRTFVSAGSGGLNNAYGMTFAPDGNLYVCSSRSNQILMYEGPNSPNGVQPGQFLGVFANTVHTYPFNLAVGPDGNLYVSCPQIDANLVPHSAVIDSYYGFSSPRAGQFIGTFVTPGTGGLTNPRSFLFDAQGHLDVADMYLNEVLQFQGPTEPNPGAYIDAYVTTGQGSLAAPNGMAIGPDGNLYVSSRNANKVTRYAPSSVASFVVTLNSASTSLVSVNYATTDGTAVSGTDYASTSGTLKFAPGVTAQTVSVPIISVASAGATKTFTVNLSQAVNATITRGQGTGSILNRMTQFFVVDSGTPNTYEYGSGGTSEEIYPQLSTNTAPRGAATTAAGATVWVVDANKTVYVYSNHGVPLGSWSAGGLSSSAQLTGIATNGTDVWLVDGYTDEVYKYSGAASLLSGSANPASSFSLASGNANPRGIVTDGTSFWVVDGAALKVFKYTLSGSLLVSWSIGPADTHPTGITIDPTNASDIWIVDNGTAKVYQYTAAAGSTSGRLNASSSFALNPYDSNPQGIAVVAAAMHFAIAAPSTTTAGNALIYTVTALDQSNNVDTGFAGTVHFSSSDSQAVLPSDATLTNGTGTFTALLKSAGNQTLTATATVTGSFTGSALVSVGAAVASKFTVTAPKTTTAGSPITVTVTATDQFGNTATSYSGTVHLSSSDGQAGLPADQVLTSTVGKFVVTLKTAGNQTITATDTASSSFTGTSSAITVGAGAAARYGITGAPNSVTAGIAFKVTLIILDAYGNALPSNYRGAVQFTSSDSQAVLPGNTTFTSGTTFSVTLETAGSQTLTATDLSTASQSGSITVTVNAAAAAQFAVVAPNTTTAGHPLVLVVTAEDPFNNIVTSYTGTAHFSSCDGRALLANDATLTGGIGFFTAILETASIQTITATDTVTRTFTGVSNPVIVSAGPFTHFGVTAPATAVTGNPFSLTVTALDAFNNPAPTYTGTIHFTGSDSGATLPPDSTLTGGVGAFTATLLAPGNQTITATDTVISSITGTAAVAARGLVVSSFAPTSTGFVATFDKAFDPTQLNLYNSAVGPVDVTLMGPSGAVRGSLLLDPTDTTITFVKTSTFTGSNFNPSTGLLAAGTYTATFRSASNSFKDLAGGLLAGNNSGVPGSNYVTTFVVNAAAVAVGIPSFARGPNGSQNINLPNNAGSVGIPLNLSNGVGVTSGQFTLQYNPALLNITGVTVNSALTGATLALDPASTTGDAVIDFSTTATLSSGPVRLGSLVATVPNSAASSYKDKALLHFASATLNGGAIAVVGDDAMQIVAYPGDVSGTGTYSPLDAALISSVAADLATGFAAYALLDPAIVGDVSGNGTVDSTDATLMNAILSGRSEPQVPPVPTGLTMAPTGPDPTLSLGRADLSPLYATPGSTVVVSVNIDTARPDGSTGMTEAILAVCFDPTVFSVSAADVELGSLPLSGSGWQLVTAINSQTGEIGIDLFSTTPIQSRAAGSLVTIALQVRQSAPAGSTALCLVNSVDPTGQRTYLTTVSDTQGALVLHPAVTAEGLGPGTPGSVIVEQSAVNSGQWAVSSGQWAAGIERWAVNGNGDIVSVLPTGHLPLPTALEQVFADLDPFPVPNAPLNSPIAADTSQIAPGLVQTIAVPAGLHDLALLVQPEVAGPQDDGGMAFDLSLGEKRGEMVFSPGRGDR